MVAPEDAVAFGSRGKSFVDTGVRVVEQVIHVSDPDRLIGPDFFCENGERYPLHGDQMRVLRIPPVISF